MTDTVFKILYIFFNGVSFLLCNFFAVADFGTIVVTSLQIFVYLTHDPLIISWFL